VHWDGGEWPWGISLVAGMVSPWAWQGRASAHGAVRARDVPGLLL